MTVCQRCVSLLLGEKIGHSRAAAAFSELTCVFVLVPGERAVLGEDFVALIAGEDFVAHARPKVEGQREGVLEGGRKIQERGQDGVGQS